MSSKYLLYCGVIAVMAKSISQMVKTLTNLWLRCMLLLRVQPGDWPVLATSLSVSICISLSEEKTLPTSFAFLKHLTLE